MLPISEFHFAFCGIATVAATLGYACARRALVLPSKADVEAGPPEERSLKRKLDDSDGDDTDSQEQPRPVKRNRTPPVDSLDPDDPDQEWEVVVAPPTYKQAIGLQQSEEPVQDMATPPQENISSIKQNVTPALEPTPPSHPQPETLSQPEEKGLEAARCSTPEPPKVSLPQNDPENPPIPPVTPLKPAGPAKSTKAFSVFSGSSSPFASYSNASGVSPFALSGQSIKSTPAWRRNNERESDVFGQATSVNPLVPSPNDALSPATATRDSSEIKSLVKPYTCLTGEEDETVDSELKGVKLFTKRGRKEFTDGMYGHIKILTQKSAAPRTSSADSQGAEAETSSRTRLLFRRDPLGQVSMNVGLNSTVRCHFDAAENILRIILMEQVATDDTSSQEDVVIYALKPGRSGKADFLSFTKTLCDHEGLRSRPVASSAAPGEAS